MSERLTRSHNGRLQAKTHVRLHYVVLLTVSVGLSHFEACAHENVAALEAQAAAVRELPAGTLHDRNEYTILGQVDGEASYAPEDGPMAATQTARHRMALEAARRSGNAIVGAHCWSFSEPGYAFSKVHCRGSAIYYLPDGGS